MKFGKAKKHGLKLHYPQRPGTVLTKGDLKHIPYYVTRKKNTQEYLMPVGSQDMVQNYKFLKNENSMFPWDGTLMFESLDHAYEVIERLVDLKNIKHLIEVILLQDVCKELNIPLDMLDLTIPVPPAPVIASAAKQSEANIVGLDGKGLKSDKL